MIDCRDVEMRERLPEYLHGTLSVSARAAVESHLASCADCAEELAMLRLIREAYAAPSRIDVSAIVAALPRRAPVRRVAPRSWRHSHAFQIAAAISFIAVGGISLTVARSFFSGDRQVAQVDSAVETGAGDSASGTGVDAVPAISFSGGVSDLGDEELEILLSAVESIEALPVAEPTTMVFSTNDRRGS